MKVVVDGQLVEYVVEGDGDVVLLLHGWGSSLHTFDQLSKDLSKDYRVIRFDFPGFGGSSKPPDSWGVTQYAQLTAAFLEKINSSQLYAVVGHSFGGRVIIKSQKLGILHPQKVILIGAAGIKPKATAKQKVVTGVAKLGKVVTMFPGLKNVRHSLRKRLYKTIGSEDYLNSQAMRQIFLNTIKEDLSAEISSITQPTTLIWGEDDTETPISDAHQMKAYIQGSELHAIADAGHFVHLDAYPEVKKIIEASL